MGFWTWAQQDPSRLAVVVPEGEQATFGELLTSANQVAHGLRALGLQAGDGIAYLMANEPAVYELVMATTQIGLYYTPINHYLVAEEISHVVADCEAKAFFVSEAFVEAGGLAADAAGIPNDNRFVIGAAGAQSGFRSYEEWKRSQPSSLPEARTAGLVMMYTSGTTGRPKGVRVPLPGTGPEEDAARRAVISTHLNIAPGDGVHLVQGPLHHSAPIGFSATALHLGHTVVLMPSWSAERALELIERYRVTNTQMVPTMFHRLLSLPDDVRASADVSSLAAVLHSAAPCPVAVKRQLLEWWGPIVWEYYGGTEGGATMVGAAEWLEHPGTVGKPWPQTVVKIIGDDGRECPSGVPGTIYMQTPFGAPDYFKDPEKTAASRRDGMFTLGDVGYFDEDGYLFLCDRKIDMIISGGVNIYPAEIEAALLGHPKVGDAAVFGVPSEEWGEEVKAVVEPRLGVRPGAALEAELIEHCRAHLAGFKCPRSVDFRAELPRDSSGKLYKRHLREEYWKEVERRI